MRILYVCHRFPYPPQARREDPPFNMIRHLSARARGDGVPRSRARTRRREEARGIAPYCADFHVAAGAANRSRRCAWSRRLPTPITVVDRLLPLADAGGDAYAGCSRASASISSSCTARRSRTTSRDVRDVPKILDFGDMDSQKWLEYARYKPFPLSARLLAGRAASCAPRSSASRGSFDLCTATTRAEWETLESYRTGAATDWFPNGVDSDYFAPTDGAVRPRHDRVRRAHGLLPEPGMHVRLLRADACRSCKRAPGLRLKLLIVGADPSPAVRRLGEIARRDRHRLGARRASLSCARRR